MIPRLKRLRVQRGWSQEELAQRADCDRIGILHYERGLRVPTIYVAQRIAVALGLPMEDVWQKDDGELAHNLPRGRKHDRPEEVSLAVSEPAEGAVDG